MHNGDYLSVLRTKTIQKKEKSEITIMHPITRFNFCVDECVGCVYRVEIVWWKGNYICLFFTSPRAEWFLKCIKYKPKGYKKVSSKTVNHTNAINRDGFSMKKIPLDIDTIVIGSGIGGLTTAGLLSRVGQTVLVLEQHYIAGGSTHCFNDGSYEFDTGIHYVGNIRSRNNKGSPISGYKNASIECKIAPVIIISTIYLFLNLRFKN